mgnify:CR=1 FL=1
MDRGLCYRLSNSHSWTNKVTPMSDPTLHHDSVSPVPPTDGDNTRAVHGGVQPNPYGAITQPIIQSATFTYEKTADVITYLKRKAGGQAVDYEEYARFGNPTVDAVERRLAALEGGDDALLYPSGMAAITSVLLSVLRPETHIIITDDCYRHTLEFCLTFLKKYHIETTIVPFNDIPALEAAIIPRKTRMIISESPTNPYLRVADLEKIVAVAKANRCLTLIDSTFASPVNQRPLAFGIDFVMHSATKYLAGHNDLLAGVIIGRADRIGALRESRVLLGGIVDPNCAYLLDRGLKTVGLRVAQHNANAQRIAEGLDGNPALTRVYYPTLFTDPEQQRIFQAQCDFPGGMVSIELAGGKAAAFEFLRRLKIGRDAVSLGGVETLVCHPKSTTHSGLSQEACRVAGITEGLVRLSIGIEDWRDLLADFEQALEDGVVDSK